MKESVKVNFIYKMIYEILAILIPLLTTGYLAKVLGVDGVGKYSYLTAILSFFTIFAGLGTTTYGTKQISINRNNIYDRSKIFYEIFIINLISTIISIIIWTIFAINSEINSIYLFALLPMLLGAIFDISWFYIGIEKVKYVMIWNIVWKITYVLFVFLFVKNENDLLLYFLINSGSFFIGSIFMWVYFSKNVCRVKFKELEINKHIKNTFIYFLPTCAISVYTVLDKALIGLYSNTMFENGCYEEARKILDLCKTVSFTAFNSVAGTRMSYIFSQNNEEEIKNKLLNSMEFILLISVGCMFGILSISKEFVLVFFGEEYFQTTYLLYLLSPIVVIAGISGCINSQFIYPSGNIKRSTLCLTISSTINLLLNIIFIPKYGSFGAAFSMVITEIIITILFVMMCKEYIKYKDLFNIIIRKLIAGLGMFIILLFIKYVFIIGNMLKIILLVIFGVIVYLIMLLLLKDRTVYMLIDIVKKYFHKSFS